MQSRNEGRTQKGVRCKESCVLFCFKMGEAPVYLLSGRNGPAEKGKLMTRGWAGVGVGGFRSGVLDRQELMGSIMEMVNLHQEQNPPKNSPTDGRQSTGPQVHAGGCMPSVLSDLEKQGHPL